MTNNKKDFIKKIIARLKANSEKANFKKELKETWDWYKWELYFGLIGLSLIILLDIIQRF